MSAPVPLRLCELLSGLASWSEPEPAEEPGPGPDPEPGAGPGPGTTCTPGYRVGLRCATPRSCRGATGPRLSAKKRTPSRHKSSATKGLLFTHEKENYKRSQQPSDIQKSARREMFPWLGGQILNDSKNPLDISFDKPDIVTKTSQCYKLSTPQSVNLTSNSIIRECREKDFTSLTPLTSSSNYNAKNHHDFISSNAKKTPLFNSMYKVKANDIKRDLFTVNENKYTNYNPTNRSVQNSVSKREIREFTPIEESVTEKYSSLSSSNYSTESSMSSDGLKPRISSKRPDSYTYPTSQNQNLLNDDASKSHRNELPEDRLKSNVVNVINQNVLTNPSPDSNTDDSNPIDVKIQRCNSFTDKKIEDISNRNDRGGGMPGIIQSKIPTHVRRETDLPIPAKSETDGSSNSSNKNDATPRQFKVIPIKGKKYTVLGKLGSGGSSEVFKVMDPKDSKMYAVKCVNLAVDSSTAENYVNEIKLLRKLQGSDRVVTMYDYDFIKEQKKLYVLLEMGDVDLSSLLKSYRTRGNHLPFPILIGYWTEMLTAVNHIHQKGIIHSDLKPANFLLVHGRLKLIDFGIASSLNSDATSILKQSTAGTFNYISPEAIAINKTGDERAKITYRSDVWSLGCILYSMLYEHTPFSHITKLLGKIAALSNPNQVIDYPPIKDVPPVLMEALRWCLTFDVKKRPTVQELIDLPYINCLEKDKKSKSAERIPMQIILKIKKALNDAEWQCIAGVLEDSLK